MLSEKPKSDEIKKTDEIKKPRLEISIGDLYFIVVDIKFIFFCHRLLKGYCSRKVKESNYEHILLILFIDRYII